MEWPSPPSWKSGTKHFQKEVCAYNLVQTSSAWKHRCARKNSLPIVSFIWNEKSADKDLFLIDAFIYAFVLSISGRRYTVEPETELYWKVPKKPVTTSFFGCRYNSAPDFGAADRTWTDTVLLPRDFKSLVSADSTTAAKPTLIISMGNGKVKNIFAFPAPAFLRRRRPLRWREYPTWAGGGLRRA